jgi:hypothetical protein
VTDSLAVATIVAALAVAAVAFVETAGNRPPGRLQFAVLGLTGAIIAVQALVAVIQLVRGDGPDATSRVVTFIGYLLFAVAVPPVAAVLGKMEPTRFGSALVGIAGVVLAVLILRLQQVWV